MKEEVSNMSPLMVDVWLLKVCLPPLPISEAHPQSLAVLHLHITRYTNVQICGGPAEIKYYSALYFGHISVFEALHITDSEI